MVAEHTTSIEIALNYIWQASCKKRGKYMSETAKMYIWMAIALIDTYIIIKNELQIRRGIENERKHNLHRKKG